MRAVEFIADRLEGKVAQRVEVTTNDEPIRVFNMDDWEEKEDDDNMVLIAKASSR
jgi:hypothetical protein